MNTTLTKSRFGSYLPPTAAQRAAVIAERIEANNRAAVWVSMAQGALFAFSAAAGAQEQK